MRNIRIEKILREWKADAGITHLMLYKLKGGVLTVYTDRPGPLIGLMGERIAHYREKLMTISHCTITEIRLEETDGIS
jgi:ribosomal protein S3